MIAVSWAPNNACMFYGKEYQVSTLGIAIGEFWWGKGLADSAIVLIIKTGGWDVIFVAMWGE